MWILVFANHIGMYGYWIMDSGCGRLLSARIFTPTSHSIMEKLVWHNDKYHCHFFIFYIYFFLNDSILNVDMETKITSFHRIVYITAFAQRSSLFCWKIVHPNHRPLRNLINSSRNITPYGDHLLYYKEAPYVFQKKKKKRRINMRI